MGPGGLPETGVSTYPPVFVVDSQASDLHLPVQRKTKWARDGQRFLLLLVGLTVIGLLVEGFLIINLYQRTQVRLAAPVSSLKERQKMEIPFPLEVPCFACRHE